MKKTRGKPRPLIGLAWDNAFSFCYADLPALLTELGADIVPFSPLRDAAPPSGCAGLYFPGGYPELHAEELAGNTPMLQALRALAHKNLPIYGECGGYIYLMRSLRLEDPSGTREYAMTGLLPTSCTLGHSRAALGYRAALALPGWPERARGSALPVPSSAHLSAQANAQTDGLAVSRAWANPSKDDLKDRDDWHRINGTPLPPLTGMFTGTTEEAPLVMDNVIPLQKGAANQSRAAKPLWVRGHEFHYAREDDGTLPSCCAPVWQLHDSKGAFLRHEGCRHGSVAGTWLHCYPEGSRTFWRVWLNTTMPLP